jgi:predicted  nucleic acid-binding Zn-ribbon protein
MDRCIENTIEFLEDQKRAIVTFSQGRYKSRIRKLAEERPGECEIIAENADGSLCAHIPVSWVKINPTKQLSEEQRAEIAERLHKK